MKKVKSLLCLVLIIAVFCSAFALPAFASSIVRWNASYSPVSGNSDNADLPTGVEEVNMGDRIYFNAQVGSDVRLKEIKVYVKEPSQSSFYLYDSERANSFLRYAYFDYKIGNQAGELKYYFEFVDLNGDSRYTPEKSLTIKESGTTGTAWNAAYSHINGNYDVDRITTDMYEANTGDRLWLNFQVGSRVQLRSIEVYVCPVGSNSFSYYDGEYASGSGFLRWAYFDYNVGNQPGTFKFRFKATATNGQSYTTPDYVITIKGNGNANGFISNDEIQRAARDYGISESSDAYQALTSINSKYADKLTSTQKDGTIIFMFEGVGSDSSSTKRMNAMCVLVKNGKIVYINRNSTSIPDYPFSPEMNYDTDMPTLKSGIYSFTTVNHQGKYAALNVSSAKVVRFRSSGYYYESTSSGINIHRRDSNSIPRSDAGWVNSAGCQLVGQSGKESNSEYARFIQALGIVGNSAKATSTYSTKVSGTYVVDRTYAYSYLSNIGYSDGAIQLIG